MSTEGRGHCPACEEDVLGERVAGRLRCPVCGTELVTRAQQDPTRDQQRSAHQSLQEMFDRLSNPDKPSSKAFLDKLKRIKPDLRHKCLEPQVEVKVSGIEGECLGVPASFGPVLSVSDRPIRLCDPITANRPELHNAADVKGAIAVVLRGGDVSFAYKSLVCQDAGAAAVIIIQTFDVWPFTPSDSAGEIEKAGGLQIPVVAISAEAGKRLTKHLETAATSALATNSRIRASLSFKADDKDHTCAICHDDLIGESTAEGIIIQLPCMHYFHEHCALPWLESKNTCPNCRYQLPTESGTGSNVRAEQDNQYGWLS